MLTFACELVARLSPNALRNVGAKSGLLISEIERAAALPAVAFSAGTNKRLGEGKGKAFEQIGMFEPRPKLSGYSLSEKAKSLKTKVQCALSTQRGSYRWACQEAIYLSAALLGR